MYQAPTEPQTIGGVLDDGLRIYRESYSKVWMFALFAGIVSLPATWAANQIDPTTVTPGDFGSLFIVIGIMALVGMIFYSMLIVRMNSVVTGTDMSVGAAASRGLRRAASYIASGILYMLILALSVFLAVAIVGIIVGVFAATSGSADSPVVAAIIGIVVLLFAALAAAYPSIVFFFYNYAAVIDNKGPGGAIAYSARLTHGNFWRTAAILTIALFIILVAYLIVMVLTSAADIAEVAGSALPGWIRALIDYVVAPAFQVLVMPLFYALPLAIYNDLKLRREGGDLAARIAAVGA
jgi:hypothetical protein